MKTINVIVALLVVIGGLNWGLVGLFGFNLVAFLFVHVPLVERLIYVLVGLSALYQLIQYKKIFSCCSGGGGE